MVEGPESLNIPENAFEAVLDFNAYLEAILHIYVNTKQD